MAKIVISKPLQSALEEFLKKNKDPELINTYLCFIEKSHNMQPVVSPKEKMIYQSEEDALRRLESENKVWHETEIKIGYSELAVNEQTKKIYICPFTGKAFGDNTSPNPQDAIYDWVSKCPENTERLDGLRVKRFYISEDPEVIRNYVVKDKREPISKKVYSLVPSGKLFNSLDALIVEYKSHYLHSISLIEMQNQNKFTIESDFLALLQSQLEDEKVAAFVEAVSEIESFQPHVARWLE